MSFMRGNLLSKTKKLVKGMAKAEPLWLKAMEEISAFDHPPSRIYALRVLELKEQGINEEQAMAVADMEYLAEKKEKKKAYARLKQIARLQGKKPPPNPYPSAIKEIQAEERKYVRDRFHNPKIREILEQQKAEANQRFGDSGW
ncbi:uncharacterized protein LOC107605344 isoform X2 [Arachis ipaensis]|uniref:uncharacterized protein LOC107605344 isoform X2 n=1 Tax=Arachis ipaensis TaxID=130454 RepID=UPI000A2B709A|nr:uncharacterized protein LOC107605344 isoform X2 [Arachis ipaensis]